MKDKGTVVNFSNKQARKTLDFILFVTKPRTLDYQNV